MPASEFTPPNAIPAATAGSRWTIANYGLVAAGIALIAAPFLPFISATAVFLGSFSRSGVEITNGEALLLCVCGGLVAFAGVQRGLGRTVANLLPFGASAAAGGLTVFYYNQVIKRVDSMGSDLGLASVGAGIWLAAGGAVLGILLAWRRS